MTPRHLQTCPRPGCPRVTGGAYCRRHGGEMSPLQARAEIVRRQVEVLGGRTDHVRYLREDERP